MKTASLIARVLLGITGAVLVLLGIAFWAGRALPLIPTHAAIGLLFVISLWVLSFLGFRAGVNRGLIAFVFVWGLIVVVIGATQLVLLPGAWHWVVQLVHLLIGIVAMYLGTILYKRISPSAS